MTDFILLLLFGAFWTWGVSCLFQEGYILEKPGNYLWGNWPKWICKPLFACPPCMSSVHGSVIAICYFDWHLYYILPYMICLCGINFIIKSILYPEYE